MSLNKANLNDVTAGLNDATAGLADVTIESICTCGGFNSFRDYCLQNNLTMLSEVTEKHLEAYKNLKGVGTMKYQIVKEKMDMYHQNNE